nr:hypothetical protein [Gammaproteobacteria bacterium]
MARPRARLPLGTSEVVIVSSVAGAARKRTTAFGLGLRGIEPVEEVPGRGLAPAIGAPAARCAFAYTRAP